MPTTFPNISIEEVSTATPQATRCCEASRGPVGARQDWARRYAHGSSAAFSMVETVVQLKPRSEWRTKYVRRWYVGEHARVHAAGAQLVSARVRAHDPRGSRPRDERATAAAGWTNAFTQPIRNRVDMLTTGIRTPIGIKVYGTDNLAGDRERVGTSIERILHEVPGTRSVLFERLSAAPTSTSSPTARVLRATACRSKP